MQRTSGLDEVATPDCHTGGAVGNGVGTARREMTTSSGGVHGVGGAEGVGPWAGRAASGDRRG